MNLQKFPLSVATYLAFALVLFSASAQESPSLLNATGGPKVIFDPAAPDAASQVSINGGPEGGASFEVTRSGIDVTVQPNGKSSYPGVVIKPPKPWDATGYGHVETKVTNNGTKPFRVTLRIDNEGPWQENRYSADVITIKPGDSKVVSTIFGYQFGKAAYALQPGAISSATIFIGKSDVEQKMRIESLISAGPAGEKPFVDPNTAAIKPKEGVILGGSGAIDAAKQIVARGAKGTVGQDGKSLQIEFPAEAKNASVLFKPAAGMWSLNQHLQVRVRVKNTGTSDITPSVRLESRGGGVSDVIAAPSPIKPGAEAEIVVPFTAAVPWKMPVDLAQEILEGKKHWTENVPGTGTTYKSSFTTGIALLPGSGAESYAVTSIIADMPPSSDLPPWLGKKPPVEGDWVQTLDENFDGDTINLKLWNIYTEKEWHLGAQTHYSKDNVIVKDGKLALRLEKKRGHHNDNPDFVANDYATGYADTFGKWTQRYGYFEARLKFPTAPSMFPAFWLMPDRGINTPAGQWGKTNARTSTKDGGMEFDIIEMLTIWGPNRGDFGMHWDDYNKYHKSIMMSSAYMHPDKEGFVTIGMLWAPGSVIRYTNGKEAARWESPRIGSIQEYIILTMISGGWESEPMDDAQLPSDFTLDYIRVWQRKDLATPEDGPKPNEGGPLAPGVTMEVKPAKTGQ